MHPVLNAGPDRAQSQAVQLEILKGIVGVEARATFANLLCWAIVAATAYILPNAEMYLIPLALRIAAMACTRSTFALVRQKLAEGAHEVPSLILLLAALFFGGIAWGATLIPVVIDPYLDPGPLLIGGVTIAGISIVVSLLLPFPPLAIAYLSGFALSFGTALMWAPEQFAAKIGMGIVGLLAIFLAYGFATVPRSRETAELIVENRELRENLSAASGLNEDLEYTDRLTALANRQAFFRHLDTAPDVESRHILIVALDHLENINDSYGHEIGDEVLIGVSGAMRSALSAADLPDAFLARLAGDEFGIILSNVDANRAYIAAEMVRHAIHRFPNKIVMEEVSVTASIGVGELFPEDSIGDVVRRAKRAVALAKKRGRNCVKRAVDVA